MGLLSRSLPRVTFEAASRGKEEEEALEAMASSSVDSGSLDSPAAPETPAAAADGGLPPGKPRYWPTQEEVLAVLGLLSAEDRRDCDADMANRYLRATGGDQRHAAKRIADTLAWRRAEQPEQMVCPACCANRKSHYMQVVGHDRQGRPLIYSCMALATNRDVEDNRKHMISCFEQAIRLMPRSQLHAQQQAAAQQAESQAAQQQQSQEQESEDEFASVASELQSQPSSEGQQQEQAQQAHAQEQAQQQAQQQARQGQQGGQQQPVESWCWVMDFHGFSIRDCDPRLAKIFLNLSAAHYPERLGTFFVVSAPTVFNTLWRAISHFIDPVTKQKIHFVNFSKKDNSKLEGLLGRYFDADTTAWLLREMGENRNKSVALSKAYSFPDLSKLAAEGRGAPDVVAAQEARRAQSTCGHDHLGSPAFLDKVEGQPDLLLPHLHNLSLGAT
ncbi:hypothetical protein ABPG75_002304 [Micractinium tetrahymenae]